MLNGRAKANRMLLHAIGFPHHPSSAYVFHLLLLRAWVKNQFRINPPRTASDITLPASHAEDARVAIGAGFRHHRHRRGTFVFGSFSPGASTGSPGENSITSLMRCCSGSLSSPSRGSVTCVSRILDSGGGQARLPCRISGAVGLRANHGKRPFARKSHSWTLAIGSYRTSLVDIAPAMKASGATYPCAHAQVDEKAGNVSGCVAESACCRKLSAQPCQHSNHRYLFR